MAGASPSVPNLAPHLPPSRRTMAAGAALGVTGLLSALDFFSPNAIYAWIFIVLMVAAILRVLSAGERSVRRTDGSTAAAQATAPASGDPVAAARPPAAPAKPAGATAANPGLRALFREALYLGVIGFGGGLAVLSQIEHRLVEHKRWISTRRFLEAAALAQSLPGAVATNALALIGLRLTGVFGALAVVAGFVLPAFLMLLLFALLYPHLRNMMAIEGIFRGLNPAVAGLVGATAVRLGGRIALTEDGQPGGWRALWHDRIQMAVLVASAFAVGFAGFGVVETVLIAGMIGVLRPPAATGLAALEGQWRWLMRRVLRAARSGAGALARPWWRRWHGPGDDDLMSIAPIGAAAMPLIATGLADRLSSLGALSGVFLRAGALTFGGGFVMIPLLEAELVRAYHWLTPRTFADAVALGQVTPGPVVITATFVGYSVAGLAGAVLATISVFAPAFLMVLIIGTSVERFRRNQTVQAFLQGIQPAVVGLLIAAVVTLVRHGVTGWPGFAIAVVAFVLLERWKLSPGRVLLGSCLVGIIWAWIAPGIRP